MTKPSLLERAARAIEPKNNEPKSVARRVKPLAEIALTNRGAAQMLEDAREAGPGAKPTNGHVTMLDGKTKLLFFTDGSLRHPGGKVNGRLSRKARAKAKRRGVR